MSGYELHFKVVPRGIHLQEVCRLGSIALSQFWTVVTLITTGSKEVDYWPIIVNQERWLVGGTKFKFHKCNSKMKHLHHTIFYYNLTEEVD